MVLGADSNPFGAVREDVHKAFRARYTILKAVFERFTEFKQGVPGRRMSLKEWEKMLKSADMFDEVGRVCA